MAKIDVKEILAGAAAGIVFPVVTTLTEDVLNNLAEKDPKKHKQALLLGKAFTSFMQPTVDGTKTKLDNKAIESIEDGIDNSASDNYVDLSAVDALLAEAEKLA